MNKPPLDSIKGSQTFKDLAKDSQIHQLQELTSCNPELSEDRWEFPSQLVLLQDKISLSYSKSMHFSDSKLALLNSHKTLLLCTLVILEVSPQFQE